MPKTRREAVVGLSRRREHTALQGQSPPALGLPAGLILLVCAAIIAGHWPSLAAKALLFDDDQYLDHNAIVSNPTWSSVRRSFVEVWEPSTVKGYYQPLSMISLMCDHAQGGRPHDLRAFHRTSLALHAANTALVIVLLYLLFGNPWTAAVTGLLFGLHPMTVEPISWVAERKTLLAAFFSLCCLVVYAIHTNKSDWRLRIGCMAMYVLSLMSKPTGTLAPFVMLLMDYWPLQRHEHVIREKMPFLAVGFASAVITCISQSRASSTTLPGPSDLLRIPLLLCYNAVFYLHKMIWPAGLSSYYGHAQQVTQSHSVICASVVVVSILILLAVASLRWTRGILAGSLIFLVMGLPAAGIIGFTSVTVADRHVYLPSIGVLMMLVSFMSWLWERDWFGPRRVRIATILVLALSLAGTEAIVTRKYLGHWCDTVSLYEYMLKVTPDAVPVHNNLAVVLSRQGRFDEAISHLRQAIELCPTYAEGHNNLGMALRAQGRLQEAIHHFDQALQIVPRSANAHCNMGIALAMQGLDDEAVEHFLQAAHLNPDAMMPWECLARIVATHADPASPRAQRVVRILDRALHSADARNQATLDELNATCRIPNKAGVRGTWTPQ